MYPVVFNSKSKLWDLAEPLKISAITVSSRFVRRSRVTWSNPTNEKTRFLLDPEIYHPAFYNIFF